MQDIKVSKLKIIFHHPKKILRKKVFFFLREFRKKKVECNKWIVSIQPKKKFEAKANKKMPSEKILDRRDLEHHLINLGHLPDDLARLPMPALRKMYAETQPNAKVLDEKQQADIAFLEREFPKLQASIRQNSETLSRFGHRLEEADRNAILQTIEASKIKLDLMKQQIITQRSELYSEMYPLLSDPSGELKRHFSARLGLPSE